MTQAERVDMPTNTTKQAASFLRLVIYLLPIFSSDGIACPIEDRGDIGASISQMG
jgi:hypothetical protein